MVPLEGYGPPTYRLQGDCSTNWARAAWWVRMELHHRCILRGRFTVCCPRCWATDPWLDWEELHLRMTESKSVALLLGYSPMVAGMGVEPIITSLWGLCDISVSLTRNVKYSFLSPTLKVLYVRVRHVCAIDSYSRTLPNDLVLSLWHITIASPKFS